MTNDIFKTIFVKAICKRVNSLFNRSKSSNRLFETSVKNDKHGNELLKSTLMLSKNKLTI